MIPGMRIFVPVAVAGLLALGCAKKSDEQQAPAAASPEFDQKWSALAEKDVEVFYIEDDRGEGLMGNVRRARARQQRRLNAKASDSPVTPAMLSHEAVQRVIRQNLAGVRACFLRIGRDGNQRSGKAIVSFEIGAGGRRAGHQGRRARVPGDVAARLRAGDGVALGVPEVAEGRPGDQLPVRVRRRLGPARFWQIQLRDFDRLDAKLPRHAAPPPDRTVDPLR